MTDLDWMHLALRLARRGYGRTSPNPMVGAVLVHRNREIGRGWHRRAGEPHAEIEALNQARARGANPAHGTLYVTLEPCSTHGRTPPCTDALRAAGLQRIVVGATDPNPKHAGRGLALLRRAGISVDAGLLESECAALNETFNHWIVHRTPWVTVKAAMTLDGKIATAAGQSKWITGERARAHAHRPAPRPRRHPRGHPNTPRRRSPTHGPTPNRPPCPIRATAKITPPVRARCPRAHSRQCPHGRRRSLARHHHRGEFERTSQTRQRARPST